MRVSGRAVAGRVLHAVLVGGGHTVWRCVAWIGGVEVKSSALLGAGRGTGWGGRIQVEKQWGEGGDEEEEDPLPLQSSSVSFRLSASQRRGLPAGPPRDLASLGLCEYRGGNCWGMWPVQLCPCGRRRGCRRQTAGCDRCSYTWEGRVNISSIYLYYNAVTDPSLSHAPFSYCMRSILAWHICHSKFLVFLLYRGGV